MSNIPLTCYDFLNKRFNCINCGYCVSYTMGRTSMKRFTKHFNQCVIMKANSAHAQDITVPSTSGKCIT